MKIEMYVLCLLKFQDDKIVFTGPELDSIKGSIANGLQSLPNQNLFIVDSSKSGDVFKVFKVHILNHQNVGSYLSPDVTIESAEIGYYHHRVIVYLKLDSVVDFSKLREVRDKLKQLVDGMIKGGVQDQINKLVLSQMVREEARVEFFYTYPLIISEKRPKRSETFPFSEETSTLCFDIVEPSRFSHSGKRHMMRVSIPSTVLYTQGRVGRDLLRDVINAIYQYCLYEKKSMDKSPFKNALDENLLTNLWTQIVDRMSGRIIEAHTIRLNALTILLIIATILLVIATFLSVVVPLILRYFGNC